MHSHEVWIVFDLAESATDVIIAQVEFFAGVGDPQVPQPY
jgi:hypothetical protein